MDAIDTSCTIYWQCWVSDEAACIYTLKQEAQMCENYHQGFCHGGFVSSCHRKSVNGVIVAVFQSISAGTKIALRSRICLFVDFYRAKVSQASFNTFVLPGWRTSGR